MAKRHPEQRQHVELPRLLVFLVVPIALGICLFGAVPKVQAATYTVTKTADTNDGTCDADCSLREAITAANAAAGADTVEFNIPTSDVGYRDYDDPDTASSGDSADGDDYWTIRPTSPLPDIVNHPLIIDGRIQTTNQGNTNTEGMEVELSGIDAGNMANNCIGSSSAKGLLYFDIPNSSSASGVYGLVVNSAQRGQGIGVCNSNPNIVIQGNYIGTDVKGINAKPNTIGTGNTSWHGAGIQINSVGTILIGGASEAERNVISGNEGKGLLIQGTGSASATIQNNYIGTNKAGNQDLGNGECGIGMGHSGTTAIGGFTVSDNVISGNTQCGIALFRQINTTISNNIIGLSADQTTAIPNNRGIDWRNDETSMTRDGIVIDSNVVSGNTNLDGIFTIFGTGVTTGGTITNNIIGTNASRTADFPGTRYGMFLGNWFGGNTMDITIEGNTIRNITTAGIYIGWSLDAGVIIRDNDVQNNPIGVQIQGNTNGGAQISQNVIARSNIGIDLAGGIEDVNKNTANDLGDADTGSNDLMNFPVISDVTFIGNGNYLIRGTMDGNTSEASFSLELCFSDSNTSGHGGCQQTIGTGIIGVGEWATTVHVDGDNGSQYRILSALATNANGSTSEFSANAYFGSPPPAPQPASPTPYTPGCSSQAPSFAPDLYQINASATTALLRFAPAGNPITAYEISYGYSDNVERFGVTFPYGATPASIEYTVNDLEPRTTYIFKARGKNGCQVGEWSRSMTITTDSHQTLGGLLYFAYYPVVRRVSRLIEW